MEELLASVDGLFSRSQSASVLSSCVVQLMGTAVVDQSAAATFKLEKCSSLPKYMVLCPLRINVVQHRFIACVCLYCCNM